jgi:hypothetical protein
MCRLGPNSGLRLPEMWLSPEVKGKIKFDGTKPNLPKGAGSFDVACASPFVTMIDYHGAAARQDSFEPKPLRRLQIRSQDCGECRFGGY